MSTWREVESAFQAHCSEEGRSGILATAALSEIRLVPEQAEYLRSKLRYLGASEADITAISVGMLYHREEIEVIPSEWSSRPPLGSRWDEYSKAYDQLNDSLRRTVYALADQCGGVAEIATLQGIADEVTHVSQYFPMCVSHRAVAEAAGLGWRGRHGLIVTPECGPALRLATLFIHGRIERQQRQLGGCGQCRDCLDVCPVLRAGAERSDRNIYREACRRRIVSLGLSEEVCGICVRVCWDTVRSRTGGLARDSDCVDGTDGPSAGAVQSA